MKYRGGYHDYKITTGAFVVYPRLIASEHRGETLREVAKSGIAGLDKMLDGGLPRGGSALVMGPPSYLLYSHGTTAALTTILALVIVPRGLAQSIAPHNLVTLVSHGLLGVTGTGMQTTALTMAPAAYVNAIRRMSAVIAVVLGRTLFRESDMGRRLVAALLACAGAACLVLAH